MIKWFAYIGILLLFVPNLSWAKIKNYQFNVYTGNHLKRALLAAALPDTAKIIKKQEPDDKKKIKEVAKTKKQPKPEKIEPAENPANTKPKAKRQRRPEGLERPPEIPRRNG